MGGIITIAKGHDASYPWRRIGTASAERGATTALRGIGHYYLSPAEKGGEPPGVWTGKGGAELGRLPYLRHRLALCALLGASQADLWPQLRRDGSWPDEVSAVYPHLDAVPHEVWLHMFRSARHGVDVLAGVELLTADGLLMNALLANPLRPGVKVRICIGEHDTPGVRGINVPRVDRGSTSTGGVALALVAELRSLGSVTVRVYEGILYDTICRADKELLAAQHAYGIDAGRGPVMLLNNVGTAGMFVAYAAGFDQVWATARSPI